MDALAFHDCDVKGIAGRQAAIPEDDRLGAIDGAEIDREHLVDDAEDGIFSRSTSVSVTSRSRSDSCR